MPQLTAHTDLIARINAAASADELAAILDTITRLDRPGFPTDLADGAYFDGLFIGTMREGQLAAVTQIHHLAPHVLTLWGELDAREADARYAAADAERAERDARRGRPEIGRPVQIRLPDWLLALVDRYADERDVSRAEAVRELVAAGHRAVRAGR